MVFLLWGILTFVGCAAPKPEAAVRPFRFEHDTFAFANQTFWVYGEDPLTGRMTHVDREPRPDFAHRCFVLVRAAKEFHGHARFDPTAPVADEAEYRRLVRRVVAKSSRRVSDKARRVVIPGYPDLRSFSAAQEKAVKAEVGGPWQSYVQRGHWRMVFPFRRSHRERIAETLARRAASGAPLVVHVVDFPSLAINHALLIYGVEPAPEGYRFVTYDPNEPTRPLDLTYSHATARFEMPRTPYFRGGTIDVYEVYRSAWY